MMTGKMPFVFRFWWLWEMIAFLLVGYAIGYGWAFLALILGSLLGFLLIRGQGIAMMKQMKSQPIQGAFVMMNAVENSLIFMSGLLLLIPGFLTDIFGIICLIPAIRRRLVRKVIGFNLSDFAKPAANQPANPSTPPPTASGNNTIEGEYWREDDEKDDK